jgi:hypothetical protein
MTTTNVTAIEKARAMGREDRAVYTNEFGEAPVVGQVGDWDATGWTEAWRTIGNTEDIAVDDYDTYNESRIAYLESLFDSTDVA